MGVTMGITMRAPVPPTISSEDLEAGLLMNQISTSPIPPGITEVATLLIPIHLAQFLEIMGFYEILSFESLILCFGIFIILLFINIYLIY